jgi:hypothetical protein
MIFRAVLAADREGFRGFDVPETLVNKIKAKAHSKEGNGVRSCTLYLFGASSGELFQDCDSTVQLFG